MKFCVNCMTNTEKFDDIRGNVMLQEHSESVEGIVFLFHRCPRCKTLTIDTFKDKDYNPNRQLEITDEVDSMDMTKYADEWLNAESISMNQSEPTKAVIKDGGQEVESKFGKKAVFTVEINGRTFKYRPSKTSIRNLINRYGEASDTWIGKEISLLALNTTIRGEIKKIVVVL